MSSESVTVIGCCHSAQTVFAYGNRLALSLLVPCIYFLGVYA